MKRQTRKYFSCMLLLTAGAFAAVSVAAAEPTGKNVDIAMDKAIEIRKKLLDDIEKKSAEAEKLRSQQSYPEASGILHAQLKRLTPQKGENMGFVAANRRSELQAEIKSLHSEWAGVIMGRARTALRDKRYNDAALIAAEAAVVDPAYADAVNRFTEAARKSARAADFSKETDIKDFEKDYIKKQKQIDILFREANTFLRNGKYNDARVRLERVFLLDPFNAQAISMLSQVYTKLYSAGNARMFADIEAMIAANSWGWIEPVFPTEIEGVKSRKTEVKTVSSESIFNRLDKIIIPEFTFTNFNITKVVAKLNEMAKDYDPDKRGVNISCALDSEKAKNCNVSMNFLQIPLSDLLRYLCMETGLKYRTEGDNIIIGTNDADMQHQIFQQVSPEMFSSFNPGDGGGAAADGAAGGGGGGGGGGGAKATKGAAKSEGEKEVTLGKKGEGVDMKEGGILDKEASTSGPAITSAFLKAYFDALGISFGEGSSIAYDRRTNRLFVRNTAENLRAIDEHIREHNSLETPLVMVELKLVEITENDWQELGFQWRFDMQDANNPTLDPTKANSGWNMTQIFDPVRGNDSSTTGSDIKLINDLKILPNFGNGLIKGVNMNMALSVEAVSRNDRTEVLSAPKLIATAGSMAQIKMVKQYYFPDSWEAPEVENSGNWQTVTIPLPEWSDPTDIGIILKVRPEVEPDNYTISLELHPEVVTFIGKSDDNVRIETGYIDYSSKEPKYIPTNIQVFNVWMPILGRRQADVFAKVYDGETIVIGGMIDNQTETRRDKWPIIGDLPLIGRLFSSEYDKKIKRNLLIFVTSRLVNNDGIPIRRNLQRGMPDFNR